MFLSRAVGVGRTQKFLTTRTVSASNKNLWGQLLRGKSLWGQLFWGLAESEGAVTVSQHDECSAYPERLSLAADIGFWSFFALC